MKPDYVRERKNKRNAKSRMKRLNEPNRGSNLRSRSNLYEKPVTRRRNPTNSSRQGSAARNHNSGSYQQSFSFEGFPFQFPNQPTEEMNTALTSNHNMTIS